MGNCLTAHLLKLNRPLLPNTPLWPISHSPAGQFMALLLVFFTWRGWWSKMASYTGGPQWRSWPSPWVFSAGFFTAWSSQGPEGQELSIRTPWKLEVAQITSITFYSSKWVVIKCSVNTGGLIQGRGCWEVWFIGGDWGSDLPCWSYSVAALLPGLCPREASAAVSQNSHAGLFIVASFPQQLTGNNRVHQ